MAVAPGEAGVAAERAEHRDPDRDERFAEHLLVAGLPTRLSTTPATRTAGSKVAKPWTRAATDWLMADASTTSSDRRVEQQRHVRGRRRGAVGRAVEQPHHPFDDQEVGAVRRLVRPSGAMASTPHIHGSRFRPGRPVARAW